MTPIDVPRGFRVIAHRGASGYAPENTRAAFALAREMGVSDVELDVQLATDGVVVVCHDRTLARYGGGDRTVESLSSRELLALDMGSWFSPAEFAGERMPTFRSLLEEFNDAFTYHVEIKGSAAGLTERTLEDITASGLNGRCVLTSFSGERLDEARALAPAMRRGWLVDALDAERLAAARGMGLAQICPRADAVDAESVRRARSVCDEVRAWGVSGERERVLELVRRVVSAGCDGMTINWPDWVRRAP